MAKYSQRDERITLKFQDEDELNDFLEIKPPRVKYEIIPYDGPEIYIKVTKSSYIKAERKKREKQRQ